VGKWGVQEGNRPEPKGGRYEAQVGIFQKRRWLIEGKTNNNVVRKRKKGAHQESAERKKALPEIATAKKKVYSVRTSNGPNCSKGKAFRGKGRNLLPPS